MKNLANCNPREFLAQTNKIRKSVEKWLTVTDILNIRKNVAKPSKVTDDMTPQEKREAVDDFMERSRQQAMKNLSAMIESIAGEHPDETLEILALVCFVEPENVCDHTMSEYLGEINELISDKNVLDFFTSLMQLVRINTST